VKEQEMGEQGRGLAGGELGESSVILVVKVGGVLLGGRRTP